MRKKYLSIAAVLLLQFFCSICFCGNKTEEISALSQLSVLLKEKAVINSDNVNKDLVYGAITGMTHALDRHTNFFTPVGLKNYQDSMHGSYGGIGAGIKAYNGMLMITSFVKNCPAEKAGLRENDKIFKIDGELTKNMNLEDAINKLRGKAGTEVIATIIRDDPEERVLNVSILREEIDSIYYYILDDIGYIIMTRFSIDVGKKLENIMTKFQKGKIKGIILDLRNNGGGDLNAAVHVVSVFVKKGELVVSTEGRSSIDNMKYPSINTQDKCNLPFIVLVNGRSASASELTSGALQDYGRCIILGTTTYGKGSVQRVYRLGDGSALKITCAHYFTPKHRLIHGIGVKPDIEEKAKSISPFIGNLISGDFFMKYAKVYLNRYPELKKNEFEINDTVIGEFACFAAEHGYLFAKDKIKEEKDALKKFIKIAINRLAFGFEEYQKTISGEDEQVKHAAELIKAMDLLFIKPLTSDTEK